MNKQTRKRIQKLKDLSRELSALDSSAFIDISFGSSNDSFKLYREWQEAIELNTKSAVLAYKRAIRIVSQE